MTEDPAIPLCVPSLGEAEAAWLRTCLESTFVSSAGPFVERFETEFAAFVGARHAVACTSGTAALHLALHAAGIGLGDRVLCSDFTFIASATPIRHCGAEPVFIDSEMRTWNLDPALVEAELAAGHRAGRPYRAVIAVHIYGQPADLGPILASCRRHGAILIEDATESLGAWYAEQHPDPGLAGRHVGTLGDYGCFSFNGNKLITTGGGGMVVAGDPEVARHVKHLSTQAKLPGIGFVHDQVGFNYRMPNLNATLGLAQLERAPAILAAKRRIWDRYQALAAEHGWMLQPVLDGARASCWMPCLLVGAARDRLIAHLARSGIAARPAWLPMARQPAFAGAARVGGTVADRLGAGAVCLPCSTDLTAADLERVCQVVADREGWE